MRCRGAYAVLLPSCLHGWAVEALLLRTCLTAVQLPLVLTERELDATASLSERIRTDARASLARGSVPALSSPLRNVWVMACLLYPVTR